MKRTIKDLLQNADASSVEEMAKLCPMTDDATKERIFRKVQQRTAKAAHPAPPSLKITQAHTERHVEWGSILSAAAACFTLIATTAGCLYLMQHKPSMIEPGMDTAQETSPAMLSVQEADEQDMPWKHHIIQSDSIGGMELEKVFRSTLTSGGETYDMLTVKYYDAGSDTPHGVVIEYSLMPAEQFWSVQDGGFTLELDEKGHFCQTVDCGAYRVSAEGNGMTEEELHVLLDALDQ
jgi:hypothetical protein